MADVLVVDDDPGVRAALTRMLAVLGHQVTTAGDDAEAVDALAKGRFQAALIDMVLPRCSGVELAATVLRRFPEMIVLAMSGGGRTDDRELLDMASEAGVHGTIVKPVRLDALGHILDTHGLRRQPAAPDRR